MPIFHSYVLVGRHTTCWRRKRPIILWYFHFLSQIIFKLTATVRLIEEQFTRLNKQTVIRFYGTIVKHALYLSLPHCGQMHNYNYGYLLGLNHNRVERMKALLWIEEHKIWNHCVLCLVTSCSRDLCTARWKQDKRKKGMRFYPLFQIR